MAMMDGMKSSMSDMNDATRARYMELKDKEDSGILDEAGRMELQDIRDRFEINE